MHPAPSIIVFTVFSGLGLGQLFWLGTVRRDLAGWDALPFFAVAFTLTTIGLVASTFHLGNPQRSLRAFTQWRSSWLSREACLAAITFALMAADAAGRIFFQQSTYLLGLVGACMALLTVFATSMIYVQLKTVPRWNHWNNSLLFILFALTGGAALSGNSVLLGFLLLVSMVQIINWRIGDRSFSSREHTIASATQLGYLGKVRLLESPHSGTNYLLKEMVFHIGRKHAQKLRLIALVCLGPVPMLIILLLPQQIIASIMATSIHLLGAVVSRWLFFAQAEHVVGLYYDQHKTTA